MLKTALCSLLEVLQIVRSPPDQSVSWSSSIRPILVLLTRPRSSSLDPLLSHEHCPGNSVSSWPSESCLVNGGFLVADALPGTRRLPGCSVASCPFDVLLPSGRSKSSLLLVVFLAVRHPPGNLTLFWLLDGLLAARRPPDHQWPSLSTRRPPGHLVLT